MTDDSEARSDFWSIEGNYIYRHHVEPRVKLYVPKEEPFPIPLRYVDVVRRTNTTLDVLVESRIEDYWNVVGTETYLNRGLVSRSSQYGMKNLQTGLQGPERG